MKLRFKGLLLWLLCWQSLHAENMSTDAIINLPIEGAWQLFTTDDGLKSLGYAEAKVELQLSGALKANGGNAVLGNVDAQVISFDTERMLSFKPAKANDQWTVLYFTAMGHEMTQLRWQDVFPDAQRGEVTTHQQQVRKLFDQLIKRFAPECHVCKEEREREAAEQKSKVP